MPRYRLYDDLSLSTDEVIKQSLLNERSVLNELILHRQQLIQQQTRHLFNRAPTAIELPSQNTTPSLKAYATALTQKARLFNTCIQSVNRYGYQSTRSADTKLTQYLESNQNNPKAIQGTLAGLETVAAQQKAIQAMSKKLRHSWLPGGTKKADAIDQAFQAIPIEERKNVLLNLARPDEVLGRISRDLDHAYMQLGQDKAINALREKFHDYLNQKDNAPTGEALLESFRADLTEAAARISAQETTEAPTAAILANYVNQNLDPAKSTIIDEDTTPPTVEPLDLNKTIKAFETYQLGKPLLDAMSKHRTSHKTTRAAKTFTEFKAQFAKITEKSEEESKAAEQETQDQKHNPQP